MEASNPNPNKSNAPHQVSPPPNATPPPLPPSTPPPGWVYYPPTPRRSLIGRVARWGFIAFVILFIISFFSNLLNTYTNEVVGPGGLSESVVRPSPSDHKIALITVSGMIQSLTGGIASGDMVETIQAQLNAAKEDPAVKAVLLKVDSPGGEVLASDLIHEAIRDFYTESRKPVIASMQGLAASGGYYVSAPCQWIVAHELTMTGSIGVILHTYNYRELMDKVGVRPLVFKSGKFKDTLRADKSEEEILPEEMAMMQDMINETYTRFKDVVRAGREKAQEVSPGQSRELVSDWETLADGRILSGSQAYEAGFVDEIGDFEDALKRAKIIAGIPDAKIIKYQRPVGFGDLFRFLGKSDLGTSGKSQRTQSLKIDLGWNRSALQPGRLYFMTPTFMGSGSTME